MFVLLAPYVYFHILSYVWVTEWSPNGKIAAYSACYMFSKYLVFSLVFQLRFWSGNFFRNSSFPDHCLHLLKKNCVVVLLSAHGYIVLWIPPLKDFF